MERVIKDQWAVTYVEVFFELFKVADQPQCLETCSKPF